MIDGNLGINPGVQSAKSIFFGVDLGEGDRGPKVYGKVN
jgi:hypothetical protein